MSAPQFGQPGWTPAGEAAAQLAAQAQNAPPADAGAAIGQMTDVRRDVLLPAEKQISDLMAQFQANQATQAAQIRALQAQLASASAAVGEPELTAAADGLAGLITAHSAVFGHPDAYQPVRAAAADLADAAKAAVAGTGPVAKVESLAAEVEKWLKKVSPSDGNWGSVLSSLESIGLAAAKLA